MSDELLRTALTDRHEAGGAKLAPFAGWLMPLEYEGTVAEHTAVRTDVGVFDVSHLGTVFVEGPDAAAVIGASFTCDPDRVEAGGSQYTFCCNEDGGIVDDLIVYRLADEDVPAGRSRPCWIAVPNAANRDRVVARLRDQAADHNATIDDVTTGHAIIAVQGPRALAVASEVMGADVADVAYLGTRAVPGGWRGGWLLMCRTGYTGEPGCELVCDNAVAGHVWDALTAAGAVPAGLGARDTLRLEMGYPLHGNDLTEDTNPYEARMGWAVRLDAGEFVGRAALERVKAEGPSRRLWGLRGQSRRPLRAGLDVLLDGRVVGTTSSGGFSPTLQVGIGLAYLADGIGPDDQVEVDVRGRAVPVTVVRPPFVDRSPRD